MMKYSQNELLEILLKSVIDAVRTEAADRLPDTHRFNPIGRRFKVPGTDYIGTLAICCSETDQHKRRLHAEVCHKDTDKAFQNIWPEMSSAEIRSYLAGPDAFREILSSVLELYEKAVSSYEKEH